MSVEFDTAGKVLVDIDPKPSIWPVCTAPRTRNDPSPCETPFVRRVGLSWTTGRHVWAWSPDCKHKIKTELVRMEYQEPEEGPVCPECGSPYKAGCGARFHDTAPDSPEGFDAVEHARSAEPPAKQDP